MSGIEIIGIAASVVQIADAGARLSSKLFVFTRKVKDADRSIQDISREIAATGAALRELGEAIEQDKYANLGSRHSFEQTTQIVADCWEAFTEINETIGGEKLVKGPDATNENVSSVVAKFKKPGLSFKQRFQFPFKEPQIMMLRSKLESLKSSLMLMLQVLLLAEQVRNRPKAQVSEEQKELIKTLVEEKNARDLEFQRSCIAIEAPPIGMLEANLEETATKDSCSLMSSATAETLVEGTATPKPPLLVEPEPVVERCASRPMPLAQANAGSPAESPPSEELTASQPSLRPSSTKSSFMSNSGTLGSFSDDASVPKSLRIRDEEIQHHAMLVHNLLEEISDVQYRIDHGIRHRMHDGILKSHWDEWAPFASKHGHDHFHRAFEQHKHVARYWLDLHEGVKPTPRAVATSNKKIVHFRDAHDRQFDLPYDQCKQWPAMMKLLADIFENDDKLIHRISTGQFDLLTKDRKFILPRFWEETIEPGMPVFMEVQLGRSIPASPAPATHRITPYIHTPVPPAAISTSGSKTLRGFPYYGSLVKSIAKDTKSKSTSRPSRNPKTARKLVLTTPDHWNYRLVDVTAIDNAKALRRLLCRELGVTESAISFYIEAGAAAEYDSSLTDDELLSAHSGADHSETPKIFVRSAPMTAVAATGGQGVVGKGTFLQGSQGGQPTVESSSARESSLDKTQLPSSNAEALQKAADEGRTQTEAKQRAYLELWQTHEDITKSKVVDFNSRRTLAYEQKEPVELAAGESSDSDSRLFRVPVSSRLGGPAKPTLSMNTGRMTGEPSLSEVVATTYTPTTANEPWSLESVTAWLAANGFSREWQEAFRTLNLQRDTFLGIGAAGGGMYILHRSVYPELLQMCVKHQKPWHPSREREEGKRLRRLVRQIVRQNDVDDTGSEPRKLFNVDPRLAGPHNWAQPVVWPSPSKPPTDEATFQIHDKVLQGLDDASQRFKPQANDILDQAQVDLLQDQIAAFKTLSKNGQVTSSIMDSILSSRSQVSRFDLTSAHATTDRLIERPDSFRDDTTYPQHSILTGDSLTFRDPPTLATAKTSSGPSSYYYAQQAATSKRPSVGSHMSQLLPLRPGETTSVSFPDRSNTLSQLPDNLRERGRCPHPECGRVFEDLKAHMLTHQMERREKCPVPTCEYHDKGFARRYDKTRHTITHFRGDLSCAFCPTLEDRPPRVYNRIDVFRRHLTSVHNARQPPPNSRKTTVGSNLSGEDESDRQHARCPNPTCDQWFNTAEEVCGHISDCIYDSILKTQRRRSPPDALIGNADPTWRMTLAQNEDAVPSVETVGDKKTSTPTNAPATTRLAGSLRTRSRGRAETLSMPGPGSRPRSRSAESTESSIERQDAGSDGNQTWTVHDSTTAKWERSKVTAKAPDPWGDFRQVLTRDRALSDQHEMPLIQGRFGEHWTAPDDVSQSSSVFKEVSSVELEQERISHELKLAKMEAELDMVFQRKVQEEESKLKRSEEEMFTQQLEMMTQLAIQVAELEKKKSRIEESRPIEEKDKSEGFSLRHSLERVLSHLRAPKETDIAEIEHDAELDDKSTKDGKERVNNGRLEHDEALEAKVLRLEELKEQRKRRDQERGDEDKQNLENLIDHIPRETLNSLESGDASFHDTEERNSPVVVRSDLDKGAATSRAQSDDQELYVHRPAISTSSDDDEIWEIDEEMETSLVAKGYDIPPPISKSAPIEAATEAPGVLDGLDMIETIRRLVAREMEMDLDEITETTDLSYLGMDSLIEMIVLDKLREEHDIDLAPSSLVGNSLSDLRKSLGLDKSEAALPQAQKHGALEHYTEIVHDLHEADQTTGRHSVSGASDQGHYRSESPESDITANPSVIFGHVGIGSRPDVWPRDASPSPEQDSDHISLGPSGSEIADADPMLQDSVYQAGASKAEHALRAILQQTKVDAASRPDSGRPLKEQSGKELGNESRSASFAKAAFQPHERSATARLKATENKSESEPVLVRVHSDVAANHLKPPTEQPRRRSFETRAKVPPISEHNFDGLREAVQDDVEGDLKAIQEIRGHHRLTLADQHGSPPVVPEQDLPDELDLEWDSDSKWKNEDEDEHDTSDGASMKAGKTTKSISVPSLAHIERRKATTYEDSRSDRESVVNEHNDTLAAQERYQAPTAEDFSTLETDIGGHDAAKEDLEGGVSNVQAGSEWYDLLAQYTTLTMDEIVGVATSVAEQKDFQR